MENSKLDITGSIRKPDILKEQKTDLTDVTFLLPIRIDSLEYIENSNAIINYILKHFLTKFIILEADSNREYYPQLVSEEIKYVFIEDHDEVFHRTKWINKLISLAKTTIVAVWDPHTIILPDQVKYAVEFLRAKKTIISIPHNGKYYDCDKVSTALFKKTLNAGVLQKRKPVMQMINSFYSFGGVFLGNREHYEYMGGENENIYGFELEHSERIKRFETLNLPISFTTESAFRLSCPKLVNASTSNSWTGIKNMKEFLRTCSINY